MADMDSKLTFTASPIYAFLPDVSKSSIRDQLDARQAQLSAMLLLITGSGSENLSCLSETHRSNYLWACSSIAEECVALTERL